MEQVFLKIDTDNSGNLSLEEVVLFLKSITDDISEENIEKIFEGIDTSGDKVVDLEEFKVKFYIHTNLQNMRQLRHCLKWTKNVSYSASFFKASKYYHNSNIR